MTESDITTQPYAIRMSDFVALSLRLYYRNLFRWPPALHALFMIGTPLLIAAVDHVGPGRAGLYLLLSLVLWLVIVPAANLWTRFPSALKNWNSVSMVTTTLTPSGIFMRGDNLDLRQDWTIYREVLVLGQSLCLHNNASGGILIKPEAFLDMAGREAFIGAARRYIRDANHPQIRVFAPETEIRGELPDLRTRSYALNFGLSLIQYTAAMSRLLLHPVMLTIMAGVIAALIWQARETIHGDWLGALPFVLASLCVVMPAFMFLMAAYNWYQVRRKGFATEKRVVAIGPEGIHTRSHRLNLFFKWRDIHKVTRAWGCSLFWFKPYQGILVGGEAFADHAEADAFHAQAVAWWQAATAEPAANSSLDAKA
ncbi:MAG: hypothetical protein JF615_02065 [Asticcacaulis sp.]|nr:hypothetical protein [Asticcacaulis sp.]